MFKTRLRLFSTGTAILIVIMILYITRNWETSCYYSEEGDALPSVDDLDFSPKEKSIFFHETSCRGGLTIRQACSVESAARTHPHWRVYVLFSSPVTYYTLKTSCLATLRKFPNVKFLRLHITEYAKGTKVESIVHKELKKSEYPIHHTADILRILTLNKWGGLYLDTDMIVTRSLDDLPSNFIAKESQKDVAIGIFAFAKDEIGTNITNAILKEISRTYDPTLWTNTGGPVIDEVLRRLCPKVVYSPTYQTSPISDCQGITIFAYDLFYPYYYNEIEYLLDPDIAAFDVGRPYTYHMWNFLTDNMTIYKDTVFAVVAKTYCPIIYSAYRDEFSADVKNQSTVKIW